MSHCKTGRYTYAIFETRQKDLFFVFYYMSENGNMKSIKVIKRIIIWQCGNFYDCCGKCLDKKLLLIIF